MTVKSTGTWVLPQPLDVQEDNEWIALPRIGRTVPFGYELDKNNDRVLRPIKLELDLLEKAKKHLKVYSYREVANWLSTQSARYISHVGLMKRVKDERRRKNKAKSLVESYMSANPLCKDTDLFDYYQEINIILEINFDTPLSFQLARQGFLEVIRMYNSSTI